MTTIQLVGSRNITAVNQRMDRKRSKRSSWRVTPRPDYLREPLDDKAPGLCSACRRIDFEAAFRDDHFRGNELGREICSFTGLSPSMRDSDCGLCRALATKVFVHRKDSTISILSGKLWLLPVSSILGHESRLTTGQPAVIGITIGTDILKLDPLYRYVSNLQGLILPGVGTTNTITLDCYGIPVPKVPDYKRLRRMLLYCARQHLDCRETTHSFPVRARVIDCRTRQVVPLSTGFRYAALSYVWGEKTSNNWQTVTHSITSEGDLPSRLPLTIEDAITTTKNLGIRYLWVDRYCIDSADKKHQLNQMANIYNQAVVTICAIESHDDAGLPGVSKARQSSDGFRMQRVPYTVCSAPGKLQQALKNSTWSTRGWTFQEALLSRRCLVFTEEETFLLCGASCQQEGLLHNVPYVDHGADHPMQNIYSVVLDHELRWNADSRLQFIDYVQHYQKRSFTMEADAFPAFKGILCVTYNQSYHGVVVADCPMSNEEYTWSAAALKRAGFVLGMVWRLDGHYKKEAKRRLSVPSWSWLAWKDALTLFPLIGGQSTSSVSKGLDCTGIPFTIDTYVAGVSAIGHDEETISMGHYLTQNKHLAVVPELSDVLEIHSLTTCFQYTRESTRIWQIVFSKDGTSRDGLLARGHFDDRQRPAKTGIAVLLLAGKFGPIGSPESYWLALRPLDDGTYQRVGILHVDHRYKWNQKISPMIRRYKDKHMRKILVK